jgi:mycothiol synthase
LTSDFRLPGVDPQVDSVGIFDGERLIGWGFLPSDSAWVDVHPDARGGGIGTWLHRWTEARAGERGASRIGQTINERATGATRLLVDAGYGTRGTAWILSLEHTERPADPTPPEGVILRAYRPGDDEEVMGMFETAFTLPDRPPSTIATWRTMTIERDGFEPEDLVLAEEAGEIVGGAFLIDSDEIWVDKLAVSGHHRHRGIARALLQVAFQRSFDMGYTVTSLSTDSRRSALTLYERVGMRVRESYTHLAIDL